ncbi:MAG: hypothetical protein AAFN77_02645 [Planctomycetota bacterium]
MFCKRNAFCCILAVALAVMLMPNTASAQRRLQLGGPFGVAIGGGGGLTIGGGYGVQLGGGQGLRFGPPGAGVQYGGGQGIRYGTPNFGVQYGGGQILRYGGPNAGVRIGGGEGVRLGTSQGGVRFGNGTGLQVGRFNNPPAVVYPNYGQPNYGQPIYQAPVQQPIVPQYQPNMIPNATGYQVQPQTITNPVPLIETPDSSATIQSNQIQVQAAPMTPTLANPVPNQTQFDAARAQPAETPAAEKPAIDPASKGKSILEKNK